MGDREELAALRRMAELEAKAGGSAPEQRPTPFVPSGEKPQPDAMSEIFQNPNMPAALAGNPVTRFALGAAAPFIGAAQLGMNAIGQGEGINAGLKGLEEAKQQGRAGIGSEGFDWTQAAGNVFSPAFLAAAKALPGGMTYLQRIMAGMGMGAAAGATNPITNGGQDFGTQKLTETALGAGIGGAVPALAPAITGPSSAVYRGLIEPWANPAAIKGRAYLQAAGDKAGDIINLLRNPQQIVPGALPNAGQAAVPAGRAEFAALQQQADDVLPSAAGALARQQNAARVGAVQSVGQTPAALQSAERVRSAAAGPLYDKARNAGNVVDATPVLQRIDLILSKNPGNKELVTELQNIRRGLLDDKGALRTDAQEISSVLDGMKAALAKEDNKFITGVLTNIKDQLVKTIPGYERAQRVFAKGSEPVNQMQVGQYLENKLVPALQQQGSDPTKLAGPAFAQSVRDAPGTIKRATGAPRFDKLDEVLTPVQVQQIESVTKDLARQAEFVGQASKGMKAAPDVASAVTSNQTRAPNILNRYAMLANAALNRLGIRADRRLALEIADEMINKPENVGKALEAAVAREARFKIIEQQLRTGKAAATGGLIQSGERESQ